MIGVAGLLRGRGKWFTLAWVIPMSSFKRVVYAPPEEGLPYLAVLLAGSDIKVMPGDNAQQAELLLAAMTKLRLVPEDPPPSRPRRGRQPRLRKVGDP